MNRTHLMSFAAIAALSMFNGAARADDGGGPYDLPTAFIADSGARFVNDGPVTCADATRDAWFMRHLTLNEGDVDLQITQPAECQRGGELIASAPSQDD